MSTKPTRSVIARKLQHLGIPLEYDEKKNPPPVLICQVGGLLENSVFSLKGGGMGVILNVSITSDLPNFAISRFELGLPWTDPNFRWLTDPAENSTAGVSAYWFPGTQLFFDHDIVLNHRSTICTNLPRGHSIEGLLLGLGYETIPAELPHGKTVPAFLTVVDQYEQQYSQELELWIDRSLERSATNASKSRRKSLLESRDPIPVCGKTD